MALSEHLNRTGIKGVRADLTNGFGKSQLAPLRDFFAARGIEINDADWGRGAKSAGRVIAVHEAHQGHNHLFAPGFREFICIRAPSPHPPRLSTSKMIEVNESGLVDLSEYAKLNPPGVHLKEAWKKVQKGALRGISISAMGRIGAIPETWAAAELVRKYNAQSKVRVYVLPSSHFLSKSDQFLPFLGVRAVDGNRCQLSTPMSSTKDRSYSSVLEDKSLYTTIADHANRLAMQSVEVSEIHVKDHVEHLFETEFDALSKFNPRFTTQYGNLTNFDRVREVKNQILGLSEDGIWLPPLI